ncbi:Protein of unknown function (part1) [Mycobacterium canettii CIPT 140070017]|nr:Protein of unknown function (part1) [Mycobacterium canettii CIPT 140070017]
MSIRRAVATPVILVTGHEGTAAVTAELLGLLTDHGTATLRSVAPGSVRRADPRPRCHRREQRRHRASMKSAIHPDHHPVVFHGARSSAATNLYWK